MGISASGPHVIVISDRLSCFYLNRAHKFRLKEIKPESDSLSNDMSLKNCSWPLKVEISANIYGSRHKQLTQN